MELTEKCKIDFEKWYFKKHCDGNVKYKDLMPHHRQDIYGWFYGVDLSFQYGVYVDFFDSVGISVSVISITSRNFYYEVSKWGVKHCKSDYLDARQEARKQAILTANNIYNQTL